MKNGKFSLKIKKKNNSKIDELLISFLCLYNYIDHKYQNNSYCNYNHQLFLELVIFFIIIISKISSILFLLLLQLFVVNIVHVLLYHLFHELLKALLQDHYQSIISPVLYTISPENFSLIFTYLTYPLKFY